VGLGLTPVQTGASSATNALLTDAYGKGKVPPEATIASDLFVAALSGNEDAVVAKMKGTIATAATAGGAAACAATGAGAVVAPVCGAVAAYITKGVVSAIVGAPRAPTCNEEWEETVNGHVAKLEPMIKTYGVDFPGGEAWLRRKVRSAVSEYYAFLYASGTYVAPGKDVPCDLYYKGTPFTGLDSIRGWRDKYTAERAAAGGALPDWKGKLERTLAGFVLEAKIERWAKAAKVARELADKEYKQLVAVCNPSVPGRPPPIRVPGQRTACENKAYDAAVSIAAASYLFGVVDGAPAILSTQSNAIRRGFVAEVEQDRAIQGLQRDAAQQKAFQEAAARLQTSQQILAAMHQPFSGTGSGVTTGQVAGFGLALFALAGAVYLYRTHT